MKQFCVLINRKPIEYFNNVILNNNGYWRFIKIPNCFVKLLSFVAIFKIKKQYKRFVVKTEKRIQSLEGVELIGLHFHIGSQITDLRVFETLCERINELQTELELHNVHLRHINVGGGLGINYKEPHLEKIAPFREYFEVFGKKLFLRPGQTLHFELGRSVVAQCGTLLSRVVYVKQGSHRKFVILDAGFSDLARVAMYGAYHHIENLGSSDMSARPLEYCDIVGPICESSDVFAQGRLINQCRRGDVVAIRSAGAYGITMASTYNCRPLPASFSDLDFTFDGGKLR